MTKEEAEAYDYISKFSRNASWESDGGDEEYGWKEKESEKKAMNKCEREKWNESLVPAVIMWYMEGPTQPDIISFLQSPQSSNKRA